MRGYFRKDLNPSFSRFTYPVKSFVGFDGDTAQNRLPLSYCVYGYNTRVYGGGIFQAHGISEATYGGRAFPVSSLESPVINAAVYRRYDYERECRDDIFVVLLKNRKIYYMRFGAESFTYSGVQLTTTKATFLNYHMHERDMFMVLTAKAPSYVFDGTNFLAFGAPTATSACVHNTRVYSVNGKTNLLSYSKAMVPTNWSASLTEGGNIAFPDEGGALTGVISWKNALYVFREFAIHRLVAYVDQADFTVTKVCSFSSKIYFDSVADCGDTMMFLTDDGICSFDGYTVKQTLRGLFPFINDPSVSKGGFFNRKYYLSVDLKRDENVVGDENVALERNGVISYDVLTGYEEIIRGVDISKFLPFSEEGTSMLLLLFGSENRGKRIGTFDDSGRLFGSPLKKVWQSPCTDLDSLDKIKVLKRMFLRSVSDIRLRLTLDKEYDITLTGGAQAKMIPVNRHAEKIGFGIETDEDELEISGVLFEFDFVRRLPNG